MAFLNRNIILTGGFFLLMPAGLFAQKNDYIVRKNDDTTYCNIKRIDPERIYFTDRENHKLYINIRDVAGYYKASRFVFVHVNDDTTAAAKNTFFIELLGNGFLYSLNYDRKIGNWKIGNRKSFSTSARLGMAYWSYGDKEYLFTQAMEFSALFNFNTWRSNFLEIGAGLTNTYYSIHYWYTPNPVFIYDTGSDYSSVLYWVPRLGYRFQRYTGGTYFKIGITPFFGIAELNRELPADDTNSQNTNFVSVGLAIGYTLKTK